MSIKQKRDNRMPIVWPLIFFISLFEYVFDYARFSFINKHIFFLIVLLICAFCVMIRARYYAPVDLVGVYVLIGFCFFSMLIYNLDFCYIMHWIAFAAAIGIPINSAQIDKVRKLFVFFGSVIAFSCVIQMVAPDIFYSVGRFLLNMEWEQEARRFASYNMYTGLSYQTGNAAFIIVVALIALLGSKKPGKRRYIPAKAALYALLYIGVALTAKRTMFIIAIVMPFIAYAISSSYVYKKKMTKRIFMLFMLLAFTVTVVLIVLPRMTDITIAQRLFSTDSLDGDYTSGRDVLYTYAWDQFLTNPVFGIGWGNFSKVTGTSVHNVYLQLLAESGVLGFILFAVVTGVMLIKTIISLIRSQNDSPTVKRVLLVSLMVQLTFLINSLTGNPLYELSSRTVYLFFCVVGLTASGKRESEIYC